MNLCVNARDAMPNGGILEVGVDSVYVDEEYVRLHFDARVGRFVVISVSDTGIGMSSEVRNKLFEPFFTTKDRGKGTGLGLSTALSIVKSHGGFMNVYSEVGKGSMFKVYLPATRENEMGRVEELQPKQAKGHGELILVVDDETPICKMTCSLLESNGYKGISANDGAEAVAVFIENRKEVKVIIMDMAMPVMDGSMSIRAIRKTDPKAKIIAVSGLPANGKLASISSTVNAFLAKPYTSERLLKTVHDVLNAE